MGRRRKICTMVPDYTNDSEISKDKHRFADTKYRRKVQYLFDLLKENFKETSTKDSLLNAILENIIDIENDIVHLAGSEKLTKYKEEFVTLFETEERVWKEKKDPSLWWEKMQEILENMKKADDNSSLDSDASSNHFSKWNMKREFLTKKLPMKRKRNSLKPNKYVNDFNDSGPFNTAEEHCSYTELTAAVNGDDSSQFSEEPSRKCSLTDEYILNSPEYFCSEEI